MKTECNCLEETKTKIIEHLKTMKNNPVGYEIIDSDWENHSWYPKVRLYVNFIIKSKFVKKDGMDSKPKNEHISIFFTYCPFCGKKYETETENIIP